MGNLRLHRTQSTARSTSASLRHAQNCCLLALRHLDEHRLDEARALLHQALAYSAEHILALRTLSSLEFTAGNLPLARAYLDRVLAKGGPEDAETAVLRGNIELGDGDPVNALAAYDRAEELAGATPELDFNRGLAHLLLGHGTEAVEIFSRQVEAQTASGRAWDALGCALRLEKRYHEATNAFLQALQADPMQNDTRDHLAQVLLEMGNPEEARHVLESALTIEPARASSRHLLGLAHAAAQEFPRAIACWEALIAGGAALPDTYYLLGNAYMQTGQRPRAITTLQTLVALQPRNFAGHLQLAMLLLEQGEFERGWQHLDQAQAIDPQNPTVAQLVRAAADMRRLHER